MAGSALPYVIGGLIGAAAVWLLKSTPASASAPSATTGCTPTSFDTMTEFTKALGYVLVFYSEKPASAWSAPTPVAGTEKGSKLKFYSVPDCAFYYWNGSKWVVDDKTALELSNWTKSHVSGHPADALMVF